MSVSTSQSGSTSHPGYPSGTYVPSVNQGLPTLIVMVVVLAIILLFCFWGAPAVRSFCKRKICCCCPMDEPTLDNGSTADGSATPTIILLPYGRMLVVDRTVFAQLQADHTGIDFMELSANLIRAQRLQNGSNPSILESEATSKGLSPTSIDFLPPAYEDIFGTKNSDLPPSYSEISIMFRKLSAVNSENSVASGSERSARIIIREPEVLDSVVSNNNNNTESNPGISDRVITSGGNAEDGTKHNENCSFNTPTLRTSFSAPFISNENECEFKRQLKEIKHDFSSLENNIERNDRENNYKTNTRRKSSENNGVVEEICSNGEFHPNAINKRLYSGPKVGNCSSPENDEAKNGLKGGNNPEPCNSVQHSHSYERRASIESRTSREYIDRESTV